MSMPCGERGWAGWRVKGSGSRCVVAVSVPAGEDTGGTPRRCEGVVETSEALSRLLQNIGRIAGSRVSSRFCGRPQAARVRESSAGNEGKSIWAPLFVQEAQTGPASAHNSITIASELLIGWYGYRCRQRARLD